MTESTPRPWYRELWPWLLLCGPAFAVLAGLITVVLAIKSDDGLVADDYYRRGLAINAAIARDDRAARLGVSAIVEFSTNRDRVRVMLAGGSRSRELRLTLAHPTRAGRDQAVLLHAVAAGIYAGTLRPLPSGTWKVVIEDEAFNWRLAGRWSSVEPRLVLGSTLR